MPPSFHTTVPVGDEGTPESVSVTVAVNVTGEISPTVSEVALGVMLVDVDLPVVVEDPIENIAYRSANTVPDCFEYHSPVNVPVNVGGRVCL